jgi:serine/threonine protein phosphatase PrpC
MPEFQPGARVLINPARRSLRIAGVLGAGLLTGAEKLRNGFRNGDSLLIDFKNRVFAIADAGERFPQASGNLLQRLAQDLDRHGPPEDAASWQARIAALWKTQLYVEKTTLSIVAVAPGSDACQCPSVPVRVCPCLPRSAGGCRLWITHGGDSRIAVIGEGGIYHRSLPDMNFAGRSLQAPALQTISVDDPEARIVLASDGLNDPFRSLDDRLEPSIPPCLRQPEVDAVVDAVFDALQAGARPYDDAGLIVVAPSDLAGCPEVRILIGARSERRHENDPRAPADVWIPLDRRPETVENLREAGIRIGLTG